MITQRLDLRMTTPLLAIRGGRSTMSLDISTPEEAIRTSTSSGRLDVQTSPPSRIQVNLDQFKSDIGFKTPQQLMEFLKDQGRSAATNGINRKVSEGDQYLKQTQTATVSQAKNAGIYTVSKPLGQGKARPEINFTEPSIVTVENALGATTVNVDARASIDLDYSPPSFQLSRRGRLDITVVPYKKARITFDRRA